MSENNSYWPVFALNSKLSINLRAKSDLSLDDAHRILSLLSLVSNAACKWNSAEDIENTLVAQMQDCMLRDLMAVPGLRKWYESYAELWKDLMRWKPRQQKLHGLEGFIIDAPTFYDLDLGMNIDAQIPRFYTCWVTGVCSNNYALFFDYCLSRIGTIVTQPSALRKFLETDTHSYLDLDQVAFRKKNSSSTYHHVDHTYRILSNNKRLFDRIIEIYPSIRPDLANKPEKRKPIPASVRHDVWDLYFEKTAGECYCCRCEISVRSWEAGHIKAAAMGGPDTVENLVPICSSCNKSMSTTNMLEFALTYYPDTAPVLFLDTAQEAIRNIKREGKTESPSEVETFSLFFDQEEITSSQSKNEVELFVKTYLWTDKVEARVLHKDYKTWAREHNYTPISVQSKEFRSKLKEAGVFSTNMDKKRYYYLK